MARSPENEAKHKRKMFLPYKGKLFGHLRVVSLVEGRGATKVKCACICGSEVTTQLTSLKCGNTKSCGCSGTLTLNKIYYTDVLSLPCKFLGYERVYNDNRGCYESKARMLFINTGNIKLYKADYVKRGCMSDELQPIVCGTGYMGKGRFNSKTKVKGKLVYGIWSGMMQRCYNPKDWRYPVYGARGVSICNKWHDFQNFALWFETTLTGMDEGSTYQVDKDLLGDAKIYSPDSCLLIPKSLNVAMQMERQCTNQYGVGIRFIENTGKYCAQVTNARGNESKRITGTHRSSLEEAKEDCIRIKTGELRRLASELLQEGSISEEIKNLVDGFDVRKALENY